MLDSRRVASSGEVQSANGGRRSSYEIRAVGACLNLNADLSSMEGQLLFEFEQTFLRLLRE